ncbi:MAG: IgGFc-binding protein, partial [Cryomorphaceae bacterium]|nr:IgGFc-binding protein [Cryomorphaceae bacterium]
MRNIILMLLMLCMIKINAQEKSILNPGTTFFLPSITSKLHSLEDRNTDRITDWKLTLIVISEKKTCVNIHSRDTSFVINLEANTARELEISTSYLFFDTIQGLGVFLEADNPINAYISLNNMKFSRSYRHFFSTLLLDENKFSSHKKNTYNFGVEKSFSSTNYSDRFFNSMEIVSLENDNQIEICFAGEVRNFVDCFQSMFSSNPFCGLVFPKNSCTVISLNRNERVAYMMGDKLENGIVSELRNSTVQSLNNKAFSIFIRSRPIHINLAGCLLIPRGHTIFNLNQNIPNKNWSSTYYIPPRPEYPYFDLSCYSNDTINYNFNGTSLVNRSAIDTSLYPTDMVVHADQPFALITGTGTNACDTSNTQNRHYFLSYPMVGPEHYYYRTCFAPFSYLDTIYNHYVVSLVVPTSGVNGVRHNGTTLNASLFTPFSADSTYSWANIEVDTGYQCIESDS